MPEQANAKPSPQEVEKMLRDYQMIQEQIRALSMQVEQLAIQKNELQTAKEEVEKSTGKVYVTVGGVIVEAKKDVALKNISEKSESGEVRIQSVNKQLNDYKSREKTLRDKITQVSNTMQQ
ncbi:MAG: prefoldin subunit [Candidatus Micrarchaeota archaeon]|nr:prefoldin subunit [Candidatus Micrarchaeota archaeon]